MLATTDPIVRNEWIVCAWVGELPVGGSKDTAILGQQIRVTRMSGEAYEVEEVSTDGGKGRELPVQIKFGCVFATLGEPVRPLPEIPEFDEGDRGVASCGCVGVNTSPYRIIENFIDMAHFSFVHTGVLGSAEKTEVLSYRTEHRKDVDEIWAFDCQYAQPTVPHSPGAANGHGEMQVTRRNYRIMSPFSAALYKPTEAEPDRNNVTTIFVQPVGETECWVYTPLAYVGAKESLSRIIAFQQSIFLQDRIILENQIPSLLPLDASYELPTRADATSIAYRRWLKSMNVRFGIYEKRAA